MKFKFRFATVLKQRKIERDIAQRDFAKAESDVRVQMNFINQLYSKIDEARQDAAVLSDDKTLVVPRLSQSEDFVKLQLIKIERERQKARELLGIMEEKQEILAEKSKSLKIVETLKEKDQQAFKLEANRKEQIEIDDLWQTRTDRRKVNV